MAIINLTEVGNNKLFKSQACSVEITGEIHSQLICLSVINSFLSITAFLGNTLILVALHKESSIHPPSKLLFRTLATTDLCVGIIAEPLAVTSWMLMVKEQWDICCYTSVVGFVTGYILCSVSLVTLTAISVDRLLALLLGLRYRQIVTLMRIYVILIVFSVLSIVFTLMYLWNREITSWCGKIVISLCLVCSVFSYAKLFFVLRHNQTQVQNHIHQGQLGHTVPLNIARYRKTVSSALWVQLALVVCYLPYVILVALNDQKQLTSSLFLAREFTETLIFLNSSLNPILYCWKIREVRQAVKETVRQLCCSCN